MIKCLLGCWKCLCSAASLGVITSYFCEIFLHYKLYPQCNCQNICNCIKLSFCVAKWYYWLKERNKIAVVLCEFAPPHPVCIHSLIHYTLTLKASNPWILKRPYILSTLVFLDKLFVSLTFSDQKQKFLGPKLILELKFLWI